MVKVKCHKHGEHLIKPTDAAVLIEHYRYMAAGLAYSEPLPENKISNINVMLNVLCPMADLEGIKSGKNSSKKSAK
jgi:hypothetical protein